MQLERIDEKKSVLIFIARKKFICIQRCVTSVFIVIYYNKKAYGLFFLFTCFMNNSSLFLSIIFAIIVGQPYGLYETEWNDHSSDIVSTTSDDDIYKCVSYTAAHIDISHSINEDFSHYKDCQTPGLYTLNRRDKRFKVDLDIQRQWIIQVSFN